MKLRAWLLAGSILFISIFLRAQDNFQVLYSASGNEVIEWIIPSNDGTLVLAGNTDSFDFQGDGLIIKTDQDGDIIWSKILGGPGWDEITKIISCFDGGFVAIGFTNSFGQGERDAWITRVSEDGEVVWSDCFGTPIWDGARGIIQTRDGGFLVVGQDNDFDVGFMLALNSDGELLWQREFMLDIVLWFNDVFETGEGGFYFTGALNYSGFGIHDTFILEADPAGNIVRCKVYGGTDNDAFRSLFPYQEGFLAVGDTWSWSSHQLGWVAKINSDLEIEKAIVLGDNSTNQYLESACNFSNSIYVDIKLTNSNSFIIELDSLLNLKQSWQFNPGLSSYSSHIIRFADGSIVFSGSATDTLALQKDLYLAKFQPVDTAYDCSTVSHSTFISDVIVQSRDLSINEIGNNAIFMQIDIQSSDISLQTKKLCSLLPLAYFISPGQACVYDPVSIIDSSMHGETYHWYFEGAIPAMSDSIDPGIIIYENPGYYSIKLVVTNAAGADSITQYITIYPFPEVYLGEDTTLQVGQTLMLDAGPAMDQYLWQDGSSSQTFEVSEEGIYCVRVDKNLCRAYDTILINFDDCLASIFIPNCFTPNGDGYNETFKPECQNLNSFNMLIFNRWGQLLFESDDPEKGWNGKVNGNLSPQGTYFYLIRFTTDCKMESEDDTRKGSVTLLE